MTNHNLENERGVVLRIERSSIHDGVGFRTVIFLKGCPLYCHWCSTPESQSFEIERTEKDTYGKLMSVEQVMAEIRKDTMFYFHSGGGMTLSGGEPLAQSKFAISLLKQAKEECYDTAIESSFYVAAETIDAALPYINMAFVDVKFFDQEKHKRFCGTGNDLILSNLTRLNQWERPLKLVIRIPLIPGLNDSAEELAQIGKFCATLRHLHQVQLLPYHNLGTVTYQKLGRKYLLPELRQPSSEHMLLCKAVVREYVEQVI